MRSGAGFNSLLLFRHQNCKEFDLVSFSGGRVPELIVLSFDVVVGAAFFSVGIIELHADAYPLLDQKVFGDANLCHQASAPRTG